MSFTGQWLHFLLRRGASTVELIHHQAGPSGDPSFFPISSTNDNQQQPGPSEGQARAPRNYIEELKEDKSLGRSFRNACIKQEEIIQVMTQLLQEQAVHIDEQEIRSGVDVYLTNTINLEPGYRNHKLKRILNDLANGRISSPYYIEILKAINN